MTCIVGFEYDGRAYIGSDSASLDGWTITEVATPKVFALGPYVIGVAGNPRLHDVLRFGFEPQPPPVPERGDFSSDAIWRHMVTSFVPALRETLVAAGFAETKDGAETMGESGFLVGVGDCVFLVDSAFQVGRSREGYNAVGVGADVALGAFWMLTKAAAWPNTKSAVIMVLEASAHHCAGVRPPFTVLATEL